MQGFSVLGMKLLAKVGKKKYGNNFVNIRGKYCLTKDSFTQILASAEAQTSERDE